MYNMLLLFWMLLLASSVISTGLSNDYEFVPDNDEIFDSCKDPDPPQGSLDVHGLFNMSELQFSFNNDVITISGNITTVWDIEPSDRITLSMSAYNYKTGAWQPTLFNLKINSFCDIMYKESGNWYKFWTQHITNDVKNECINTPGTKLIHETFDFELSFPALDRSIQGSYKFQSTFKAYDEKNFQRSSVICTEIRGELRKI